MRSLLFNTLSRLKLKDTCSLERNLQSREITLPIKVQIVKAMVYPVVMYGCESWTIKKAECLRIDTFILWFWRRLLRVPQTARRSNLSILKEATLNIHWKDYCWSWSSYTLASWCKELTPWEKTLMLGKIEFKRRGRWKRMKWLDSHGIIPNTGRLWKTGKQHSVLQSMGSQRLRHDWET